ncbi:MAG: PadR family transcriptional regulator [Nitrososphaerota archaeon]
MREMKKGSLGLLILHLLHERASYGYELTERLRERSQGDLTFEDAAVYPILHAFERDQLVEGVWEHDGESPDARKGARRRYYHLTPRGVEALRAALQDWATFSTAVDRVLGTGHLSGEGIQ